MKYMLLIYSEEKTWTQEELAQCDVDSNPICNNLQTRKQLISAARLDEVASAISVRIREGKRITTDGPFAETTEQLGGFLIVEVANLDEAISIAVQLPPAKKGTVEIRPLVILENLPKEALSHQDLVSKPGYSEFILLCYDDEQAWDQAGKAAHEAAMNEAIELTRRLAAAGQFLSASPLHAVSTATSVKVRDGKRMITDGPFAETREFLGGYFLILAKDHDDACNCAAQHPGARFGSVEVRQVLGHCVIGQ